MNVFPLLLVILAATVQYGDTTACPISTADGDTKPLYLLQLSPDFNNYLGTRFLTSALIAQEEINNRSDILPGYHIELIEDRIEVCSSPDAGIGLVNLVKHTVSPPCRPVVAVIGLVCPSHTSILYPVVSYEGFDLIQMSLRSPVLNKRIPHLWHFIGNATVYSDIVLAIMDQFNWTRVGVVYSSGSSLTLGRRVTVVVWSFINLTLGRRVTVVVLSFYLSICQQRYREQRSLLRAS